MDSHYTSTIENSHVALTARIVDRTGRSIRRADVKAVEYWIYLLDRRLSSGGRVAPSHDGIALDIRDVLFDSLQTHGAWSFDAIGYNFRHEFDLARDPALACAARRFKIVYLFTPRCGSKMTIQFHLRNLSR